MLIRKDFEKIQKITGFNLELLEKTYHLTRILNEIQKNLILKESLTLKGGTALNFIYLDVPRLSIDMDFDFTKHNTKEEMIKQREIIEREIKEIASKLNYNLKDRGSSYIISRQSLQYQTIRNTKDHIKIEINYLNRTPLSKREEKEFSSIFPDIQKFKVITYPIEELIAQKAIACLNRYEPRDLYDLQMLSKQKISIEKTRVFAAIYLCISANNKTDISKIKDFNIIKIKQELQQFIRNNEGINPDMIRDEALLFLEEILKFDKKQKKFIDTFFNEKKIIAELIDVDKKKILQHPALFHKLRDKKHI